MTAPDQVPAMIAAPGGNPAHAGPNPAGSIKRGRQVSPLDVQAAISMIRAAALAGLPAPTNKALATRIGKQSMSSGAAVVKQAERDGLILVRRGSGSRVIAAPDDSWRTAGHVAVERDYPVGMCRPRAAKKGAAMLAVARARTAPVVPVPPVAVLPEPARPAPLAKPTLRAPVAISWAADGRGCRWPMWSNSERPTHVFCDAPRETICRPYCAEHAAVAYPRRGEAA